MSYVHIYKSTFGYTIAIDNIPMPMDVGYAEAARWLDVLVEAGLKTGPRERRKPSLEEKDDYYEFDPGDCD